MKKAIIILTWIFSCSAFSQNINSHDTVAVYNAETAIVGERAIKIPVNFDEDNLLKQVPDSLKDLSIIRIDLVYTVYKSNPEFDQVALNNRRIANFRKSWPGADNALINWRTVGQSQAVEESAARQMFHGFVIYYRPKPTEESMRAEIEFLDEVLGMSDDKEVSNNEVVEANDVSIERVEPEGTSLSIGIDPIEMETEKFTWKTEHGKAAYTEGKCYETRYFFFDGKKETLESKVDSVSGEDGFAWYGYGSSRSKGFGVRRYHVYVMYELDSCGVDKSSTLKRGGYSVITYMPDWMAGGDYGVVEAVFKRNPGWTNSLVVMDVTGSMSPYIAKTMSWVKSTQDSSQVEAFVFFNDGDSKRDSQKRAGSVGGIYGTRNTGFKPVYSTMKSTMQKGGGGDCPENNVEATLKGIKDYPDCDEVIMVVDNWATPRDLKFVRDLDRPVHIIVCGGSVGINVDYIQLALDTGGSIHTIEEDLNTRDIQPGKSFKLGKYYYTLLDGKVVKAEIK